MNAKVWELFYQADAVRTMLTRLIREESLRTYLFTYSHVYDSISMETLASMFELAKPIVHSIISKMIINEELMVSYLITKLRGNDFFFVRLLIFFLIYRLRQMIPLRRWLCIVVNPPGCSLSLCSSLIRLIISQIQMNVFLR